MQQERGGKYKENHRGAGSERQSPGASDCKSAANEKARHYLWKIWNRLPKTGHIAIFDRTWYGRVMVEDGGLSAARMNGSVPTMRLMNLKKELSDWGAVIIKFWVQIDKDSWLDLRNAIYLQKQWKITDETEITEKNGICMICRK